MTLTDTLSLAAQIVISPTTGQGTCTAVADPFWTLQCGLDSIPAGETITVTYAVAPTPAPSSLELRRTTLGSAGGTTGSGNLRLHGTLGQSSPIGNQLVTILDHTTEFALFGRTENNVRVFLPLVIGQ